MVLCALVLATLGLARTQEPASYILGPEDIVTVTVVDQPKFSGDYLIPESGRISLPVLGDVTVTDMSIEKLHGLILTAMKKRLVHPEVIVSLKSSRIKRIYVFGDVQKPGVIDLKVGWRIAELISAVGGMSSGVDQRDIRVILDHANGSKVDMSLDEALDSKALLRAGDVVRVQGASLVSIYVAGKVKLPGVYRLREKDAGLLEAITLAGGMSDNANLTSVRIQHADGTDQTVDLSNLLLNGAPIQLPRLRHGDIVVVAESQAHFAILGFIAKPGYYPIPSGKTLDLSQAVAIAGGNDRRARLRRVGVMTVENGREVRRVYDFGKFLLRGDMDSNPMIHAGDVIYLPETEKLDLTTILSGLATGAILYKSFIR